MVPFADTQCRRKFREQSASYEESPKSRESSGRVESRRLTNRVVSSRRFVSISEVAKHVFTHVIGRCRTRTNTASVVARSKMDNLGNDPVRGTGDTTRRTGGGGGDSGGWLDRHQPDEAVVVPGQIATERPKPELTAL